MSDGGKGSSPRPISVPMDQFDNNWDRIFKKIDDSVDKNAGSPFDEKEKQGCSEIIKRQTDEMINEVVKCII